MLVVIFAATFMKVLMPRWTEAFSSTYSAKVFSANVTELLDGLLANYDKGIRPGHGGRLGQIRSQNLYISFI